MRLARGKRVAFILSLLVLLLGGVVSRAKAGSLAFVEVYRHGVGEVRALALSPGGAHLYAVGAKGLPAVSFHHRDPVTGALSYIGSVWQDVGGIDGLQGASAVAVSPDGGQVYVTGGASVAVFSRDPSTGVLTPLQVEWDGVGGIDGILGGRSIAVSSDGMYLYVAGWVDDAVAVFSRNPVSGTLTFVEAERDGGGTEPGLNGAWSIAVSPDGKHVYVGGLASIKVFNRDASTGGLTFVEAYGGGASGILSQYTISSVSISPDGRHVYIAKRRSSDGGGWVTLFSRDSATGRLSFVERYRNGVGGVWRMDRPESVSVSPDGGAVYVASSSDGSVAVFSRDAVSGRLAFVQLERDGVGTVDGLGGAAALVSSPDGRNLYAAGAEDALAVFSSVCGNGWLDAGEHCDDGNILRDDGCNTTCQVGKCFACTGQPSVCVFDDGASCNDFNECTAGDTCVAGECVGTFADGAPCDDGNGCTVNDSCSAGSCIGGEVPRVGCRRPAQPGAAQLTLKKGRSGSEGDSLTWKWLRGEETTLADLGDPRIRADYWFCVFDESEGTPRLVLGAQAPAGADCAGGVSCWKATGLKGLKYRSRYLKPDGLRSIVLRAGQAGSAKILVRGKGWRLGMPRLPFTPKVTVQLSNDETNVCWEAEYSNPVANDATLFRARSD